MEDAVIYHVWFATKRRKWLLQGEGKDAVEEQLRAVAMEKRSDLLECTAMVDHVHLLVRTSPEHLSEAMRILKGGCSFRIFRRFPELKLDAGTAGFWQTRYAAKIIAPRTVTAVAEYIKTQDKRLEKYVR
ncbi:MAG: IS200/IS605 family transposase [Dehalococcoidia bacterium]|nr:IS200/IS605 family transposase [Dehalococcoidia bacterium]